MTLLVAGWVRSTAGFWIPGSAVVVAAFCAWARTLRGGRALDAFLGRIPLVGVAWTSPPWTLWALAVSDALTAGLALPHALRMAAGVVVRPHLASDLAGVADAVERGAYDVTANPAGEVLVLWAQDHDIAPEGIWFSWYR